MKQSDFVRVFKSKRIYSFLFLIAFSFLQSQTIAKNHKSNFWETVQLGGGFGFNLGSGYTEIALAPSAIYPVNQYISVGTGLLSSFAISKNHYTTAVYGVSAISLFNPIEKVQLSLEVEQARVNTQFQMMPNPVTKNYWNTGLYVGAGYRNGNATLGARYNLLFDKDKSIYSDALMPFVRFYF